MIERPQNSEDKKRHTLGIKSRFGEFLFKFPWYAMISLLVVLVSLIFALDPGGEKSILAIKIIVPIFVCTTATMRFLHRNSCYKLVIDDNDKTIHFYLMFNQGVFETAISNIKIVIDRNINCVVNGRKFKIMTHYLHDIVDILPEETDIQFVGFFGRQLEKELARTGRGLRNG